VVAVEVPSESVAEAVRAAIADGGEAPQRTLVVTDALESLGELRALGVGVEHLPARGSRQAELAGVPYERFVAGRLELIRAERPRPRATRIATGGLRVPSVP
jgi:hypothetical protein